MPAKRLTDEQERALHGEWKAAAGKLSVRAAARKWGVDFHAARRAIRRHEPAVVAAPDVRRVEAGDEGSIEWDSDEQVRTLDEAVTYAKVDLSVWYVERWECSGWQVPVRVRAGQDADRRWKADQPAVKQMWRVLIKLRRILPQPYLKASEAIFGRLAEAARVMPPVQRFPPARPHLLEVSLSDVHFGKLAWAPEVGEDYDLRIAERVYRNAVDDLIAYASPYEAEEVLFLIGSDFFHVDSLTSTTTKGTPQDTDSRYAKMVEVGEVAVIEAIAKLRRVAPVKAVWVPGNHDRIGSYHLARTVKAWFSRCDDVTVDVSPATRKYHRYGKTLLGFTHGDTAPASRLPALMMTERRADWAEVEHGEWHIGHFHQRRRQSTQPVATHDGIVVQTLMALCGHDAWHHEKGYIGRRAGEAFVYDREHGPVANIYATARD